MNKTIHVITKNGVVSKSTSKGMKIWQDMGYKVILLDLSVEHQLCGVKIDKMWLDEEIILDNKKS